MAVDLSGANGLVVRAFRVHSIAFADPPLRSSYGLHAPYALRTILEIEAENGVVGLGETHGGSAPLAELDALREQIVGARVADLLDGDALSGAGPRAFGAVEVALLDLVGKTIGQPVHALLGGAVRREIPFSAYAFYKHAGGGGVGGDARHDEYGEALTPDGLVAQVRAMIARYGFGSVKLKAGVLEPDDEIETIRALRRALGPTVPLRIDPNCVWNVETSLRVARALREELSGGGYLEDPTDGIANMAEVRKRMLAEDIETPLASNIAVISFETLEKSIPVDAVQVVLGDHHYWGGPRAIARLAARCETANLGLSMHSNSHLGVSLMAMAHIAAATKHLTYACDTHYPWQDDTDEVIDGGKIPIENGCVRLTDAPGLGVTLNPDALARGRACYDNCGMTARDDVVEMRKHVDPTWQRRFW